MTTIDPDLLIGAIARGWCATANSHKEVDPDLAISIALELDPIIEQYAAERAAEALKPLNFDQLQGVMSAHFGSHELTDDEKDSAEAFARAIERAHGMGEQQNG